MHAADPSKVVVASIAPSVRVTVPEALGLPADTKQLNWEHELVASLRQLGFPTVFDTNFAADLTIVEEGTELLHRCAPHCILLLCLAVTHAARGRVDSATSVNTPLHIAPWS